MLRAAQSKGTCFPLLLLRDLQRPVLEVFPDDQVEEELTDSIFSILGEDSLDVLGLELDSGHRVQVLAEDDRARAEGNDQDQQQENGERNEHERGDVLRHGCVSLRSTES